MSKANGAGPQRCGSCVHWFQKPRNPAALGEPVRGDCRCGPPHATTVPVHDQRGNQIGMSVMSSYPDVPENFQACAQFKGKLAMVAEA